MRSIVHMRGLGFMAAALIGLAARAQSFPADSSWVEFWCAGEVMNDPYRDESGAIDERDLVGNPTDAAATAYRAGDGQYLYLRVRLDQNPIPGGNPRPFAWGLLLDLDGDLQNYEVLLMMNGIDETVSLYENTFTTLPNDPTDPPDEPAVATYSFEWNARTVVGGGSSFGGATDYFLDIAIPWRDLERVGLYPSTPVTVWAATSSTSTTLNGDFACWNDALGSPTLFETAARVTVLDPGVDSDFDGYTDVYEYRMGRDPGNAADHPSGDPDRRVLAGGGGCSAASGAAGALALVIVACALVLRRRRTLPAQS
jgi:uncharacterized protein (TIGR03382 family)